MLGHSYIIVVSTAALGTSDPLDPPFTLLTTPNLPVPPKHPAPPIAPATISCNNPHISSFACRHSCTDNSNSLRTPHGLCLDALAWPSASALPAIAEVSQRPTPHLSCPLYHAVLEFPLVAFGTLHSRPVSPPPLFAATPGRLALVATSRQPCGSAYCLCLGDSTAPSPVLLHARKPVRLCTTSCPTAKALAVQGVLLHSLAH